MNDKINVSKVLTDEVTIIDGTTNDIISNVEVGDGPFALEYNSENNAIYVANRDSDTVSILYSTQTVIVKPIADAGPDQTIESNDLVQLDSNNRSDPNGSPLTYSWNQTSGPEVILNDPTSSNPTFIAPDINEETSLEFELTVTNYQGESSEPDEVTITINPISSSPPEEQPRTMGDIIKGIIQNPLDITNSMDSTNEIRDIQTDDNQDNGQLAYEFLDAQDEHTFSIRETLNC
jgi:DNA-binding beta-propeller fold protein YncE